MTTADRSRRYRERQTLGLQLVTVEIDQGTAENLVARGLVEPERIGDRDAIATALLALARAEPRGPVDAKARITKLFGCRE